MSDPKEYVPFRDHILEHGHGVESKIVAHIADQPDCGDPGCKFPAFWDGLTDEQLSGAAIVLSRFAHDMRPSNPLAAVERYGELLVHIHSERLRRDGKVLEWTCLSEGSE